jgi:phage shock protein C
MGLADDIERLESLLVRGVLTREEFERGKELLLSGKSAPPPVLNSSPESWFNQVRRSRRDVWLGGVCGGLGELTPVPSWVWRLLFALTILYAGLGLVVYILLWIFVPDGPDAPGSAYKN